MAGTALVKPEQWLVEGQTVWVISLEIGAVRRVVSLGEETPSLTNREISPANESSTRQGRERRSAKNVSSLALSLPRLAGKPQPPSPPSLILLGWSVESVDDHRLLHLPLPAHHRTSILSGHVRS